MTRQFLKSIFRRSWLRKARLHSRLLKNRFGTRNFSDFEDLIPKTGIHKNKSQTSDIFSALKNHLQLTTIDHQNTTTSPQKTTLKHTDFSNTPRKNARKTEAIGTYGHPSFFLQKLLKISTADTNKPAHTGTDTHTPEEEEADTAGSSAAAPAESPRPTGSTPPATPS
jgi:hypothetical protein